MKKCNLFVLTFLLLCGTSLGQTIHVSGVPTPEKLKELAESLPPYSAERDCGFEALSVFERFGGELVIAQQGFINDGIYSVKKTTAWCKHGTKRAACLEHHQWNSD